jgi:GntR family transcriptional regulator
MERDGFVTKKRGVGTFIHRSALEATCRIEMEATFDELIKSAGFTPSRERGALRWIPCNAETARALRASEGDEALLADILMLADGTPAVYCINVIPKAIIKRDAVQNFRGNIFTLLGSIATKKSSTA